MRNIPTDIYIENGAVKNHGGEIAELGKKAMIVTGRHSSAVNGSLDDVKAVLESQGIGYVIYLSLIHICVTTGALYFFFKNKNDLFKAIVDEPLKELCRLLTEHYMQDAQDMDSDDPAVLSAEYHIDTHTDLDKLVDYMYLHYDVFMLLLTGAQGSEYENTVDMIVDMTEQGFRISAEKAAARMPNCHVDEYMLPVSYTHLDVYKRQE